MQPASRALQLRSIRLARARAYCFAGEHSTFISLHTRSTLSMTSAAAFGCEPVCADVTSRCVTVVAQRADLDAGDLLAVGELDEHARRRLRA